MIILIKIFRRICSGKRTHISSMYHCWI